MARAAEDASVSSFHVEYIPSSASRSGRGPCRLEVFRQSVRSRPSVGLLLSPGSVEGDDLGPMQPLMVFHEHSASAKWGVPGWRQGR